jgi:hypothetical protein
MSGNNVSNVFIVDCENIGAKALEKVVKHIDDLGSTQVVLFVSQNVSKGAVREMIVNVLSNTGISIKVERHSAIGKDALDKMIVTYLTLRINEDYKFYIVSNDKGYLAATEFLAEKGYENASLLRPSVVHESGDADLLSSMRLGYA